MRIHACSAAGGIAFFGGNDFGAGGKTLIIAVGVRWLVFAMWRYLGWTCVALHFLAVTLAEAANGKIGGNFSAATP